MKIVELIRLEENTEYGTFGVLKINKEVFCVTLEPSDELNAPFISSIPAQQYMCKPVISPRHGATFEVVKVPNRTGILFHSGNVVDDTEGCILLAEHFGKLRGNRAILNSGQTFSNFLHTMRDGDNYENFHLTIKAIY